jgi:hypothetical protein
MYGFTKEHFYQNRLKSSKMELHKELRVGNLGQTTDSDNWNPFARKAPVEVTVSILQLIKASKTLYEPITLTAEWLERLGFEQREHGWYCIKYVALNDDDQKNDLTYQAYVRHTVEITVNVESFKCCIINVSNEDYGANTKTDIKYVHQLQNLIFALTGIEPTQKEDNE